MDEYLSNFLYPMEFLSVTKRNNTTNGNLKQELAKKELDAVGSAYRLLQYCQIPDKNSSDISRDIWNFRGASEFHLFIPRFFAEPLTIFCGALLCKHWSAVLC